MADFVVTGTGRCGTAHFWRVLKGLGVPATHEKFFDSNRLTFDEADGRSYRAFPSNDISLMAAPFLGEVGVPAIHLVRNPVDCVNSFLHLHLALSPHPTYQHPLARFIHHWIDLEGGTEEELWVDYWEKWNRLCAAEAAITLRVESLTKGEVSEDTLTPLVGAAGFVRRWQELGVTTNRAHQVSAGRIPEHLLPRLRRAGEAYGYES